MAYKGYTPEQGKRSAKYIAAQMEQISLKVWKGDKAKLEAVAEANGCSVRRFIIDSVNARAGYEVLTVSRQSLEDASTAKQPGEDC